jgi:hypothetical protein
MFNGLEPILKHAKVKAQSFSLDVVSLEAKSALISAAPESGTCVLFLLVIHAIKYQHAQSIPNKPRITRAAVRHCNDSIFLNA